MINSPIFILGYQDKDFTFFGAEYCLKNDDYMCSLNLMKELRYTNYPAKETKKIQLGLAEKLANYNLSSFNKSDPEAQLSSYINKDDKWFRYFTNAYLRASSDK